MKVNPCVYKMNKRELFHVVKYCPFGFWFSFFYLIFLVRKIQKRFRRKMRIQWQRTFGGEKKDFAQEK